MVSTVTKYAHAGLLWRFAIMLAFVALAFAVMWPEHNARAHAGHGVHNATRQKIEQNHGANVTIEVTDPDLHDGAWTYQRGGTVQTDSSAWRYGEIGWIKRDHATQPWRVLAVWDNAYGRDEDDYHFNRHATNGYFIVEYHEPTGKHRFYGGSTSPPTYRLAKDLHFNNDQADKVFCGGETAYGIEGMGNTRCGNGGDNGLLYLEVDGTSYIRWDGHVQEHNTSPYTITLNNDHNYRSTGNE